jgi:hypothetical protein
MSSVEFKYNNGDEVKDSITRFKGVVVAQTKWLNGCVRYLIQPQNLKDGNTIEAESIDEGQLEMVKAAKPKKAVKGVEDPGGPFPSPKRARDPK